MSGSKRRLRPPPAERFAGAEHRIDLTSALESLRKEPAGKDNHRQITLFRKGSLRLVLFAFEPGGRLVAHHAPGIVAIHALRGRVSVVTPNDTHELTTGALLVLDPEIVHEVRAHEAADILLTLSLSS